MAYTAPPRPSAKGPTLELERVLGELADRADEMMRSQSRLRDLIRLNNDLTSNLDLATVLRKIVEVGIELIHAEYGAMGVIAPDQSMEQFITVGMDAETIARVGEMPEGKGLLGALIADPTPVRIANISDDARSSGFPPHHPPMNSFLGVPIRVRDKVYGNLYLTDSHYGEFTADDEELAQSLAATAGIAIANARLFEDAVYREKWASALAETARRLMTDEDDEHLGFLVDRVRELADADLVCIGLVTTAHDDLIVDRAVGVGAEELLGVSFSLTSAVVGEAIRSAKTVTIPDLSLIAEVGGVNAKRLGATMVIPFTIGDGGAGILSLSRLAGRVDFTSRDVDMGTSFAAHIGVSIDRAETRMIRRRVALLEDRSRIARDLHDHVIQRLFATGLNLQAAAADLAPGPGTVITDQIREIDGAIAQIRQSIFALRRDAEVTSVSLRHRVLEVIDRSGLSDSSGPRPLVSFLGPVDLMAGATLTDDVTAVVTEALANVIRHAGAQQVEVVISAAAGHLSVEVTDDGVGPGTGSRLSGLANLRARADAHGGSFVVGPGPTGGTQLVWSAPV